ncbi:UNVERIFIED_CONTAM: Retrovirus-related Pol polyprotein from transposon TNT 1-94 [Sesamum latifolium]|uniref:Retrovirus-related Pol polyprotein from transposon TNT 1-94 n=1 Tax=Sesamum latifolium TaxID=2727402 RepID=A0AAW2TAM8_9LAMI
MDDEDWEELQQRAARTIRLCLANEIMYQVMNLSRRRGSNLMQHVNVFNQIIADLARLDVSNEDEDRAIILLCSLPFSYEHLVTTLTYGKETIKVAEIIAALLAHNQRKQNAGESSHGDSLYVKGNHDRGWKLEKGVLENEIPDRSQGVKR